MSPSKGKRMRSTGPEGLGFSRYFFGIRLTRSLTREQIALLYRPKTILSMLDGNVSPLLRFGPGFTPSPCLTVPILKVRRPSEM